MSGTVFHSGLITLAYLGNRHKKNNFLITILLERAFNFRQLKDIPGINQYEDGLQKAWYLRRMWTYTQLCDNLCNKNAPSMATDP